MISIKMPMGVDNNMLFSNLSQRSTSHKLNICKPRIQLLTNDVYIKHSDCILGADANGFFR